MANGEEKEERDGVLKTKREREGGMDDEATSAEMDEEKKSDYS
jgi:hypothetical protein